MKSSTKIWLAYSAMGVIISLAIMTLFDRFPDFRLFSNEAVIFGVMFAQMGAAVRKASVSAR